MNTLLHSTSTEPIRIATLRAVAIDLSARAIARYKTWASRRRTRAQMAEFDDAMLRDLGLSRAGADFEASKPFWQP